MPAGRCRATGPWRSSATLCFWPALERTIKSPDRKFANLARTPGLLGLELGNYALDLKRQNWLV
jgi:hypothetical protein